MKQDPYDGPQGGGISTEQEGVILSDTRGREVYLRWSDAILYANRILLDAAVRGLMKEMADEVVGLFAQMQSPYDGAPTDMYGDDVDG